MSTYGALYWSILLLSLHWHHSLGSLRYFRYSLSGALSEKREWGLNYEQHILVVGKVGFDHFRLYIYVIIYEHFYYM